MNFHDVVVNIHLGVTILGILSSKGPISPFLSKSIPPLFSYSMFLCFFALSTAVNDMYGCNSLGYTYGL